RGGTQPTVTDAHVALGRISSQQMSGGVALDVAGARAAIAALAKGLGETEARTATAIIATADATMARALRRVSVERGVDPRTCTLIAFGGGGPLHACGLADLLGVTRIVAPPHAGVLSALGLAITPERREAMVSVVRTLDEWLDRERNEAMDTVAELAWPRLQNPKPKARSWMVRARYRGQGHELDIPLTQRQPKDEIRAAFEAQHTKRYGFTLAAPVEIVSLRHVAEGVGRTAKFARSGGKGPKRLVGPASLALDDATLFVAKGWTARLHDTGAWILTRGA
ncbi:MAG TPA: hydantoinase/oxoprolinase family protein, partial [Gemmatimonadaceae bacterium]